MVIVQSLISNWRRNNESELRNDSKKGLKKTQIAYRQQPTASETALCPLCSALFVLHMDNQTTSNTNILSLPADSVFIFRYVFIEISQKVTKSVYQHIRSPTNQYFISYLFNWYKNWKKSQCLTENNPANKSLSNWLDKNYIKFFAGFVALCKEPDQQATKKLLTIRLMMKDIILY